MDENSSVSEYYSIRRVGQPPKYTPEELLKKANQYFLWCVNNPMQKEEILKYKDTYERVNISVLRVYTIEGFCTFADLHSNSFYEYCKKSQYLGITTYIRNVIYTQKFEGAAGGFFKENLIIRDLKLKDTSDINYNNHPKRLNSAEVKLLQENMGQDYGPLPKQQITIDIEHEEIK